MLNKLLKSVQVLMFSIVLPYCVVAVSHNFTALKQQLIHINALCPHHSHSETDHQKIILQDSASPGATAEGTGMPQVTQQHMRFLSGLMHPREVSTAMYRPMVMNKFINDDNLSAA